MEYSLVFNALTLRTSQLSSNPAKHASLSTLGYISAGVSLKLLS